MPWRAATLAIMSLVSIFAFMPLDLIQLLVIPAQNLKTLLRDKLKCGLSNRLPESSFAAPTSPERPAPCLRIVLRDEDGAGELIRCRE